MWTVCEAPAWLADRSAFADTIAAVAKRASAIRWRPRQYIVDQDGTADMRHARIGVVYDVTFLRASSSSSKGPTVEDERRSTGMLIAHIVHSKVWRCWPLAVDGAQLVRIDCAIDSARPARQLPG